MVEKNKKKFLVGVCCAACASHVFSELENEDYITLAYFYHPEVHGRREYQNRLKDLEKLCKERNIQIIVPPYDIQDFLSVLMPYQDKNSLKYISDKKRYRRKRCQLCISLLMQNLVREAKKLKIRNITTTLLCSPYRDHDEIWDRGLELSTANKLNFYYKDFRKGYWKGRNFARNHGILIPTYCGCNESLEEGRLE